MSKKALLINYKYCSGCHSCEIACRNHLQCGLGKWGIKLTEIQPFEAHPGDWNWDYVPVPTKLCDQCAERVEAGEKPACVKHCQSFCMEYGTPEEMARFKDAFAKVMAGQMGPLEVKTAMLRDERRDGSLTLV